MSVWSLRWHFTNKSVTAGTLRYYELLSVTQLDTMVKSMMTETVPFVFVWLFNPAIELIHQWSGWLCRYDLSAEKKVACIAELFGLVHGHAKSLIFAHDTSRVIQTLMKYGTAEMKETIFHELRGLLCFASILLFYCILFITFAF